MLLLSEKLFDVPIMSLQTGSELARSKQPIINPYTLSIIALYVDDAHSIVLHVDDIREVSTIGYIIDDNDKLMSLENLVRLQEVIDLGFSLIGLPVWDSYGNKLGKVSDYTYDESRFEIQQLFIKQSFFRSISNTSNIVHRRQIISVTTEKVIVEIPTIKDKLTERAEAATQFVNPFRSNPQPDHDHPKLL